MSSVVLAAGGPFGIDRKIDFDDSGVWARETQKAFAVGTALLLVGSGLFEGSDTRLGKALWRSIDSMVLGDLSASALKIVFRRQRPSNTDDPNLFFQSAMNSSFPSGEVTQITSIVTPLIFEYHEDTPAVWLLAALPAYVGAARLKSQAHWQSDVLAGLALGGGVGYWASRQDRSWSAGLLPDGFSIRYNKRF